MKYKEICLQAKGTLFTLAALTRDNEIFFQYEENLIFYIDGLLLIE